MKTSIDCIVRSVKSLIINNVGLILTLILTFFLNIAVRMIELPLWKNHFFQIGDEYLMATHDA